MVQPPIALTAQNRALLESYRQALEHHGVDVTDETGRRLGVEVLGERCGMYLELAERVVDALHRIALEHTEARAS